MGPPNQDIVGAWCKKMGMPFDSIAKVEREGEPGTTRKA
jgi:hypothetical protein